MMPRAEPGLLSATLDPDRPELCAMQAARKAVASQTPEQRRETARKALAKRDPEAHREAVRKGLEARSPEARQATIRKRAETRRRNREAASGEAPDS